MKSTKVVADELLERAREQFRAVVQGRRLKLGEDDAVPIEGYGWAVGVGYGGDSVYFVQEQERDWDDPGVCFDWEQGMNPVEVERLGVGALLELAAAFEGAEETDEPFHPGGSDEEE